MKTSEEGKMFIKKHELLCLVTHNTKNGVLKIGYGHTDDVYMGMKIDKQQAEKLFIEDIEKAEACINSLVKVPLSQGQYDALISFTFCFGEKVFMRTAILKLLNDGDYNGAADKFLIWDRYQGRADSSMHLRREKEREMFLA